MEVLFRPFVFGADERAVLDRDGHFALPGVLSDAACAQLTAALARIQSLPRDDEEYIPSRFAAEFDAYLESLIGHPQLLDLVRRVLGPEIRYDHCVALNREGGNPGSNWHSHEYADDDPGLGFVRVFFLRQWLCSRRRRVEGSAGGAICIGIRASTRSRMLRWRKGGWRGRRIRLAANRSRLRSCRCRRGRWC